MYKIHVYTENSAKLFTYDSNVLPMVGDVYAEPPECEGHFVVTNRILHTSIHMMNAITIWVKSK